MLVDIELFRADEISAGPGKIALPNGATRAHAFLTLDGELELRLETGEQTLEPGMWAFVPANVGWSLSSNRPVRLLHLQVAAGESREPVIRRAGGSEGDTITNRPNRRATVLVETDELTISDFDYGPGERGAPRHVHREHADAFLVMEGEFTFHLRDGPRTFPAGTLVVFPPGVVHGFDNDSDGHTRAFNFHAPSFRFADYMRGLNPDFDQFDPPEDGGVDPTAVVVARLSQ